MPLAGSPLADGCCSEDDGSASWQRRCRAVVLLLLVVGGLRLGYEVVYVLIGPNVHEVVPGKVYRSAQPSPALVAQLVRDHDVRTIVNLRGCAPPLDWYQDEAQTTYALDLGQEDVSFSAGRIPSSSEVRRLIEVLDRAAYPILIHCRRGADRTGLTAVALLLLQDDKVGLAQARAALGPRFGHLSLGRTAHMAAFFRYYEDWLRDHHLEHSKEVFRRWALDEYRCGPCGCVFEKCTLPRQPIRAKEPLTLQVRVRNAGSRPWRFSPVRSAGVHLIYVLFHPNGSEVSQGRGGLFEATVAPGECIDLPLPINPVLAPGCYRLVLDMMDEQMGGFYQMGSEPFETRLDVRE